MKTFRESPELRRRIIYDGLICLGIFLILCLFSSPIVCYLIVMK